MNGKKAKRLRREAAQSSANGSLAFDKYKKSKKKEVNPHYAPVIDWTPKPPGLKFTGPYVKIRKEKNDETTD